MQARGRQSAVFIRKVLDNMQAMDANLDEHRNQRRSAPPATLALRPPRQLTEQHMFPNFETFLHIDTDEQRGKLQSDDSASAASARRGFSTMISFADVLGSGKPPADLNDCCHLLRRTLRVCMQLANVRDLKWNMSLLCATLAEVFLEARPYSIASHRIASHRIA